MVFADLLTVVSDRISRTFNMSEATRAVVEFGMLIYLVNLNLMEFLVRYFSLCLLFSVIGSFRWF